MLSVSSTRIAAIALVALMLTGCASTQQAAAFYMFGSYFPSWLIGAAVGIVAAVIIRVFLIKVGIDDALSLRLLFYSCLALIIAMAFSFAFSPQ